MKTNPDTLRPFDFSCELLKERRTVTQKIVDPSSSCLRYHIISDLLSSNSVKTTSGIIIEHISHNPGRETPDRLNGEFVVIENEGNETVSLAGWSLTDETKTGERRHVYKFPQKVSLATRERAVIHTGPGEDLLEKGQPPTWKLHWGRHAFVWNNEGDTASLFDADGSKVDSLQVVTLKAQ